MHYWQRFKQHFTIRVALPHLLLGVIAAAFSLSAQSTLPASQQQAASIITIASVMVSLHEYQSDNQVQPIGLASCHRQLSRAIPFLAATYTERLTVIRLTPYNGIRAGPTFLA
ncbi:hypothetical protein [Orbus hercynius]|nr:hypothetical protein [Orbus hercynius]